MIIYKNLDRQVVTKQQAEMMDYYKIETIDDATGAIKTIESYKKNIKRSSRHLDYFLEDGENITDIVTDYINQDDLQRTVTIHLNKQSAHGFNQWNYETYSKDGMIWHKGLKVFDGQNRLIYKCYNNLVSNEITYHPHSPFKYYFAGPNDPEDLELHFTYELDSLTQEIKLSVYDRNETSGNIHLMNETSFIRWFGIDFWNAHPYYHTPDISLPTSPNI